MVTINISVSNISDRIYADEEPVGQGVKMHAKTMENVELTDPGVAGQQKAWRFRLNPILSRTTIFVEKVVGCKMIGFKISLPNE